MARFNRDTDRAGRAVDLLQGGREPFQKSDDALGRQELVLARDLPDLRDGLLNAGIAWTATFSPKTRSANLRFGSRRKGYSLSLDGCDSAMYIYMYILPTGWSRI